MNDMVKELVSKLNKLREEYYNGSSDINDEEFDYYERQLKSLDPNNDYFNQVGSEINYESEKVEHEIPMLSMQKVQTSEDAQKWVNNIGVEYVWIDPKLDGISGKIVYDSLGNLKYVSTRGDGLTGALIQFGDKIESVPKKFLPNSELRGEFIIFKKHQPKFNGPLRNICSGILKRKNYTDEVKYISFVIYDIYKYDNTFEFTDRGDKIKRINDILLNNGEKFNIIPCFKTNNVKEAYELYVNELRDKWEYETDGIIMTVDGDKSVYDSINSRYKITTFNRFNMAVKPPAQFAESEILDIVPSVNRRKISYVARIKPVQLLDAVVSNATLDNYQNIKKNNIGIGTTVLVKRSNDVIPKVYNFYNNPNKEIKSIDLTHCPICGSKLVPVYQDLMCANEFGCAGVYKSKIENIITSFEVKNIGEAIIDEITNILIKKYHSYSLYHFFKAFMPKRNTYEVETEIVEYFNSGKRPEIFKTAIFSLFDKLTEPKLIGSFNIPYIGETSLISHKITSLDTLEKYILELGKKPLLKSAFDITIFNWWRNNDLGRNDLIQCIYILKPYFKDVKSSEDKMTYCISGSVPEGYSNKQDFIDKVNSLTSEYVYVKDVTSSTNILVTCEQNTSKVIKAHKYGINVMNFDDFLKSIV